MNKRSLLLLLAACLLCSCSSRYLVQGPQGSIATKMRLPKGFNPETDSVEMVVLMHGIFASKDFLPMPKIARELRRQGIASIAIDFGGHGQSQGKKVNMTIPKEIAEARAVYDYVSALPYVSRISLLGHSQGGVIASMLAGELAEEGKAPNRLVLLAPGAVIKEACQGGHFFRNTFDPQNPPSFIRCYGFFKVGREYMLTSQTLDIYGTSEHFQGPVCLIHGTDDHIVPLWCTQRYDSIYQHSQFHLIKGEVHTMHKHLDETTELILQFLSSSKPSDALPLSQDSQKPCHEQCYGVGH